MQKCSASVLFLSLLFLCVSVAQALPQGWREEVFSGTTRYQELDGCIQAHAHGTASGLVKEGTFAVTEQSRLQWAWRAKQQPDWPSVDEQTKAGDDFVARVYVVKRSRLPWRSRAINYVWSRQSPPGEDWANPYARQARMVVVQGPEQPPGSDRWFYFSRDIQADFKRYHGLDVDSVDALAIMTDGDDSGTEVRACYQLPEIIRQPAD